jgi:GNAT superfamily N-acetyltransferase
MGAVAWDAHALAGVAACSADSDDMWQVGIDVLPAYRGRGIAKWLVHEVTRAILDHEKVPYYSCGLHNLASQRIAFAVGYWPAWTSIESRRQTQVRNAAEARASMPGGAPAYREYTTPLDLVV